jgi:hypothetical protein
MDNMIRKLVVSGLTVLGMAGSVVAIAGTTPEFCHSPMFESLPATEVSNMFDLNKAGLASRLSAEKMMFTTQGYQGYLKALHQSGYLTLVQRGIKISAKADGSPAVSGPCTAPTVHIPARFTFTNSQGTHQRQYTVAMAFHAVSAIPMPKIAQVVVIPNPKLKLSHGTE